MRRILMVTVPAARTAASTPPDRPSRTDDLPAPDRPVLIRVVVERR